MKKLIVRITLLGLMLMAFNNHVQASNGSANSTGNWNNPSTWLINGVARVPTCGDTVTIPAGFTVTVNNQQAYGCTTPLLIIVNGTLQFTAGNKLDLPCGSDVRINVGGILKKGIGGGNSNYISICNTILWSASDGNISGPAEIGGSGLPIKLLSFDAKVNVGKVILSWITVTEINNDYFTVERSANGTEFSSVGQIAGTGNSTVNISYSITDASPINGFSYYRLKQTDFDGRFTYSSVMPVFFSMNRKNIFISAGMSQNSATILYASESVGSAQVCISDVLGNSIFTTTVMFEKGANVLKIETPALSEGIYVITLINSDERESKRLILN